MVYMVRRSYGKARQSTPITDLVKAEQGQFTWQAGAARSRVGANSVSLSLSKLGIGSLLMFCFDSRKGNDDVGRHSPYCFFFSQKKKSSHENGVVLVCLTLAVTDL